MAYIRCCKSVKIMDEFEVQCNECDWQGYAMDLVSKTEALDDKDFNYCPDCGSGDIEDIDLEDDED